MYDYLSFLLFFAAFIMCIGIAGHIVGIVRAHHR